MTRSLICSLLIGAVMAVKAAAGEEFREELTLRPLPDGKVAAHFSFSTLLRGAVPRVPSSLGTDDTCTLHFTLREATPGLADRGCLASLCSCSCLFPAQHYSIFPLALGQILREHAIPEFHLTINSGKWDYDRWGHPGEPGVGSGAELWAWMGDEAQKEAKYVPSCFHKSSLPFSRPPHCDLADGW